MEFSATTTFKQAEDVVSRSNQDGSFVIMKMDDSNVFFKIEGVAAQVWKQLHEGHSPEKIIENIQQEYDVEASEATKDVNEFIKQVLEKEIILINS